MPFETIKTINKNTLKKTPILAFIVLNEIMDRTTRKFIEKTLTKL